MKFCVLVVLFTVTFVVDTVISAESASKLENSEPELILKIAKNKENSEPEPILKIAKNKENSEPQPILKIATNNVTDNATTIIPVSTITAIITTEIPKTSTTIKPTPSKPEVGNWNVTDKGSHIPCIKFASIVELTVPYNTTSNIVKEEYIYVPSHANSTGSCHGANNTQSLTLSWGNATEPNSLTLTFVENPKHYVLHAIEVDISTSQFKNISEKLPYLSFSKTNLTHLGAPTNLSYVCSKPDSIQLGRNKQNDTNKAVLKFTELKAIAFNKKVLNGTDNFGEAKNCEQFVTPDVVPIIVGCTLALLVIVVLVAYLIGRRRSQARGYLSM